MKKLRARILMGAALALSASPTFAQNLLTLYAAAHRYDMRYAQSGASYSEARTLRPAARSAFFPHIRANANTSYNELNTEILGASPGFAFPSGQFNFNSNGYSLSVTETLLSIQSLYAYQAADQTLAAARTHYQLAESRLILSVARHYFTFLLAKDDLRLRHAEERALRAALARAKRSFRLGTATITDANEARARYEAVRAETLVADNAVRIARSRVERMTAQPARHFWPLNFKRLPPPPALRSLAAEERRAGRQSLLLKVAKAQARVDQALVEASRAGRYPTIKAEAAYSYSRAGNSMFGFGSVVRQKTIGLDLSLPIYQGGELAAASAKASAQAFKAKIVALRTARLVQFNVHQAFLNVKNGYAEVRALKIAERSAQIALSSDRLGLKVGVRNNVDILHSQQVYYRTRRDYARAVYGYLLSRLSLKAAVHELTIGDIRRLNALLRPPAGPSVPKATPGSPG